jgi:hypothetical protein
MANMIYSFPNLQKFIDGETADLVDREAAKRLTGKMSPNRARELAAAQVVRDYRTEYALLESLCRLESRLPQTDDNDDLYRLYDNVTAREEEMSIQSWVVQLTGTRTLILDLDEGEYKE